MDDFHQLYQDAHKKMLLRLIANKIIEQIKNQDVEVKQTKINDIYNRITNLDNISDLSNFDLEISDEDIIEPKAGKDQKVIVSLSSADLEALFEQVEVFLQEALSETIEDSGNKLYEWYTTNSGEALEIDRNSRSNFRQTIHLHWGQALEKLEVFIGICLEQGIRLNNEYKENNLEFSDIKFEVLTHLHGRGCQVAQEIWLLLNNGFADGAQARWRTLHELGVVANFINQNSDDVASRYQLHALIDDYKSMQKYQEHHLKMGWSPIDHDEMEEAKQIYDSLVNTYGKEFKQDYGWASKVLNQKNPNLYDLEKYVGLEHTRYAFKYACGNIHAGSRGTFNRLGNHPNKDFILAGASVWGFSEPARMTTYSLGLLTAELVTYNDSVTNLAVIKMMGLLQKDVYEVFNQSETDLYKKYDETSQDIET